MLLKFHSVETKQKTQVPIPLVPRELDLCTTDAYSNRLRELHSMYTGLGGTVKNIGYD